MCRPNLEATDTHRELDLHLLLRLPIQHGSTERRGYRDVSGVDVHRVGDHQLPDLGLLRVQVLHRHARAEPDPVLGNLGEVDLRQLCQALAQLSQPRLDEALALDGGLEVCVLPQVSQLPGLLESLGQHHVHFVVQGLDFGLQALADGFQHRGMIATFGSVGKAYSCPHPVDMQVDRGHI